MPNGFSDLVKLYIDNLNLPNDTKVKLLASNPKTLADVSLWLENNREIKPEQNPRNPFAREIKTDKVKDISLFSNKSNNNNKTFFNTGGLVDTDDASWGLGIDRSQSAAPVEHYSSVTTPSTKPNPQSNSEPVQKAPDSAERTLEEQAQDNAIASIRESASSALETVMLQTDGQGKISKVYNNIKEYFDSEMSASAVCRSIYSEQISADLLESAQNKDLTVEKYWRTKIEQTITMLTGGKELSDEDKSLIMSSLLEYTPEELEKLINELKITNNYQNLSIDEIQKKIFKSTKMEFYGDGRARTVENQNSIKSILLNGNGDRLMTFEEVWKAERGVDYNPEAIQIYEEASAKYTLVAMAEARTESIHKLLDEQIALVDGNNQNAIDPKTAQICQDRLKNSLLTSLKELYGDNEEKINAELQRLSDGQMAYKGGKIGYKLNALAGYNLVNVSKKLLEEIDSRLEKIQGGKTGDDYANEMAQAYKAAYGEKNAAQIAKAFVNDQEEITGTVRTGVEIVGMG